ncbi:TPA: fimbrial protein [Pseudomonas aeruginosa]|nr:type 1 fimbrial protein [Pseudomonas aeruginosa]HCE5960161.1 type 1 fimbrial protein [Pseudomonas aeruginosa]
MIRSTWISSIFFIFAGYVLHNDAVAAVVCGLGEKKIINANVNLNVGALDVGPEVAVGAEVYSQEYRHRAEMLDLNCTFGRENDVVHIYFEGSPHYGKYNNVSNAEYRYIYKTGLDGLGVAFYNRFARRDAGDMEALGMKSRFFVDAKTGGACNVGVSCKLDYEPLLDIVLLKVGEVKSGLLRDIPPLFMRVQAGNATHTVFRMNISSNLSIVSKTCLARPVEVNIGEHSTRVFSGIGSTAPSKDFSIELTNCPAFSGSGKKTLKFRIDPVLPAHSASNGVLRLENSGKNAATGVGVQIVTVKDSPLFLGKIQDSSLPLRSTEASYSIPLRARYIQTESKVTPGGAKSTASFTIIYQ